MYGTRISMCVAALASIWSMAAFAADQPEPTIGGNYVLEYRELPDGKQVRPPEIIGLCTWAGAYRNFNVYWTENGQPVSISMVATYTFTPTQYSEQCLYFAANNWSGEKGMHYQTTPASGTSPVTIKGDQIQFRLPMHGEPAVVFDAKGFTASMPNAFVDHWRKTD